MLLVHCSSLVTAAVAVSNCRVYTLEGAVLRPLPRLRALLQGEASNAAYPK